MPAAACLGTSAATAEIMRFSTFITISTAALSMLAATGCSSDNKDDITDTLLESIVSGDDEIPESPSTAAGMQMCMDAVMSLPRHGIPTRCDVALATDCAD